MANPVAYARVHDAAHPSYYDVVLPDSQEAEMWAYDLLPLYSGATIAALQARIAELEAREAKLGECLKDRDWLHVNMLRGVVAIPTWRTMVHLRGEVPNGEDVQLSRIAELQEKLEAAEARNAASERDAAKWRNHVESSDASHTHRCRRCGWNYSPVAGTSEDCPACGFDGVGDAHAQGQAGEGKDG